MSQCLLRRMTSRFLSLSKMRFDFLDVTVYGSSLHQLYSPCSLFCLFPPPTHTLLLEVMNMKSEAACVAASSLSSTVIPKYKTQPQVTVAYSFIHHMYFQSRLPWTTMTTLFGESHLNGSRKSLLDYLTSSPIRLIWISNLGTCTKAPAEAALTAHWAYYTCTTRFILVSL